MQAQLVIGGTLQLEKRNRNCTCIVKNKMKKNNE